MKNCQILKQEKTFRKKKILTFICWEYTNHVFVEISEIKSYIYVIKLKMEITL